MFSQLFHWIVDEVLFCRMRSLDEAYGKIITYKKAIESGEYRIVVHREK